MVHRKRVKIYKTPVHLLVTLLFVAIPFIFLLLFSTISNIQITVLSIDIFSSVWRLLIAYLIAAFLGWAFAVSFYRGKASEVALPIFDVLQSFPTFAALPLAVYLWGKSDFTVIVFLVLTVIWPIFFSILSSLKLIQHNWEEAADIYGLSGWSYVKHFLVPVSIPGLITGSIIGLGEGWEALVATEIIVEIKDGLGEFFKSYEQNPTITTFGILGLLLLIFSINKLVWIPMLDWAHRRMEE